MSFLWNHSCNSLFSASCARGEVGFSREDGGEGTRTVIADLPTHPGDILFGCRQEVAGLVHALTSDVPGQACSGLVREGHALVGPLRTVGTGYLIDGEVPHRDGIDGLSARSPSPDDTVCGLSLNVVRMDSARDAYKLRELLDRLL